VVKFQFIDAGYLSAEEDILVLLEEENYPHGDFLTCLFYASHDNYHATLLILCDTGMHF
jgi:hypothetical protein